MAKKTLSYAEAAIPDSLELLNLRLLPFSAGHYLILERYGSPFVKGGDIYKDDICLAVLVLSMSYEEFLSFINQENFNHQVCEWGLTVGDFDLKEHIQKLRTYLESGVNVPKYWIEDDTDGEETGAHWIQSLLLVATGKLGYTMTEARNTPLTQLLYDVLKFAQDNGSIRLMTEEEIEMAEG